ncbi:MAG: cell envelope integrity protein TolA, partial [Psychrobium sp.]
ISATIKGHWVTDQSMKGKECVINIRLASSGFVTQVKRVSGDSIVCQSAIAAVRKADTLPVSKDPQVYAKLKEINLTVQPEFD